MEQFFQTMYTAGTLIALLASILIIYYRIRTLLKKSSQPNCYLHRILITQTFCVIGFGLMLLGLGINKNSPGWLMPTITIIFLLDGIVLVSDIQRLAKLAKSLNINIDGRDDENLKKVLELLKDNPQITTANVIQQIISIDFISGAPDQPDPENTKEDKKEWQPTTSETASRKPSLLFSFKTIFINNPSLEIQIIFSTS